MFPDDSDTTGIATTLRTVRFSNKQSINSFNKVKMRAIILKELIFTKCLGYCSLLVEIKYLMPKAKQRKVYYSPYSFLEVSVHTQLAPKQGGIAEG